MKKLLIILLALVMCLSVFVSCAKDNEDDKEKEKTSDPAKDIASVATAINGLNLKDIVKATVDTAFSNDTQTQLNDLLEELTKINGEANVSCKNEDQNTQQYYVGMKDGIVKLTVEGQDGFLFFADGTPVMISPYRNGYKISASNDMPNAITGGMVAVGGFDLSQYEEIVNTYLTEDVMKALEGFKLDISADDITAKDGFYFLSEEVFVKIANEVCDTVVDVMKAMGAPAEELPSEDDLKEAKAEIEKVIKELNLELGFAVKNEKVVGLKFATEFDPNSFSLGGTANKEEPTEPIPPTEAPANTVTPKSARTTAAAESSSEDKLALAFTVMLDEKTMLPDTLDMSIEISEDESKMSYEYKITYLYNAENMPVGADLKFDMAMEGTSIGWYYEDATNTDITIIGTQKISANVKFDLSKMSTVGATVADVTLTMDSTPSKYMKWEYTNETSKRVEVTDSALIQKVEAANEYVKKGKFAASAKVSNTGVLSFDYKVESSYDGKKFETQQTVNGTFAWTAAPNFGTINEDLRKKFIENPEIAAHLVRLTEKGNELSSQIYTKDPNDYCDYTWYDSESGLWVHFNRWEILGFYTEQPTDLVIK